MHIYTDAKNDRQIGRVRGGGTRQTDERRVSLGVQIQGPVLLNPQRIATRTKPRLERQMESASGRM